MGEDHASFTFTFTFTFLRWRAEACPVVRHRHGVRCRRWLRPKRGVGSGNGHRHGVWHMAGCGVQCVNTILGVRLI